MIELDFGEHLVPCHHWHGHVADHDIRPSRQKLVQTFATIGCFDRLKACVMQFLDKQTPDVAFVVDA
jgi:hypothetical protein